MAKPYDASMPAELDLTGGYTIQLTALDPGSGATVSGITVSNLVLLVNTVGATVPTDLAVGPYLLVPGLNA